MSYHATGAVTSDLLPLDVPLPTWGWVPDLYSDVKEHAASQTSALAPSASTDSMKKGLVPGAPSPGVTQYPWGQPSPATAALQKQLNALLRPKGLCPVSEDGKLGAGTCGAAKTFGMAPSTCQSFAPVRSCGVATPPALPNSTQPTQAIRGRSALYVAGGILAVGVVAFFVTRKKGS